MIVKYVASSNKKKSLILDKEYLVLSISFETLAKSDREVVEIVIENEDSYPCVYDIKEFTIVSNYLPPDWAISYSSTRELYSFEPKEFSGYFWENFHAGDAKSEEVYQTVVNKIKSFHGWEVLKPLMNLEDLKFNMEYDILSDEDISHIKRYLKNEKPECLESIIRIVKEFKFKEVTEELRNHLNHCDKSIRFLTIETLLKDLKDLDSVPQVYKLFNEDPDPTVRFYALNNLIVLIDELKDNDLKRKIAHHFYKILLEKDTTKNNTMIRTSLIDSLGEVLNISQAKENPNPLLEALRTKYQIE